MSVRSLIDECILTIAPSVARTTFPHQPIKPLTPRTKYTLEWLKGLVPQQLAAILLERHRMAADDLTHFRYGIPAGDPAGDVVRARVANGWRVLQRLSNISREVHAKDVSIYKQLLSSRYKLESLLQKDDVVLERRLAYMKNLSDDLAKDYRFMFTLLSATFSTSIKNIGGDHEPWIFDFGDGIDGQRAIRRGESWLTWFVLAEGPEMFWKQWWSLPLESSQNYIRDLALSTFRKLPSALTDHQRALAQRYAESTYKSAALHDLFNSLRLLGDYATRRSQDEQAGGTQEKRVMAHVHFPVNFRCPDDVVKKFERLGGRNLIVQFEGSTELGAVI
ncbi:hypothetical protein N0V83_009617 [Neocucurbitaria cava]|uniref:Uncharacterized protein n=1 Tax=Neocucurbitaria cava TaxID=798079 RepID=A0A9W8Y0X4_9PLEO|nr:hypothetical protein N0V83_009617 [Neocucurbitaria cava]